MRKLNYHSTPRWRPRQDGIDRGTLFNRGARLISECAAVDVYEVDLILVNISCNPAFEPLWADFPQGIKEVILQAMLDSGLARARRPHLAQPMEACSSIT